MFIRLAKFTDLNAIQEYEKQEALNRFDGNFFSSQVWRHSIESSEVLGSFNSDNQLLGFLRFTCAPDQFRILYLHVASGNRRQGIGEALLKKALEIGDEKSLEAGLSVGVVNKGAQRLYERFGFVSTIKPEKVDRDVISFEMKRPPAQRFDR